MIFGRLCRCFAVLILSLDEILKVHCSLDSSIVWFVTTGIVIPLGSIFVFSCPLLEFDTFSPDGLFFPAYSVLESSLGFGNKLFPYLTASYLVDIGVPIVNQIQDVVNIP